MKELMKILWVIIGLCGLSACTANFEEINTNPNKTEVGLVKAYNMFEPILYNGANTWQNYTWFWNDELIQFTAFTGGTTREEHRYQIADGNWASIWNAYSSYATNALHMYDLAQEQGDKALQAVALTMKVLFLSNLTDMYGDIPYSEAFTARKSSGTTTPKFDSQKDVYEEMFADLETANSLYAENPVFPKSSLDGMYGGDMTLWRKFNNSLYLRLICRVSGRSEMNPSTLYAKILNNTSTYPIFTSNADNATVKFSGVDAYKNYFSEYTESNFTGSGRKLTEQFIKMTVVTENGSQVYEDPRLPIWGKKYPNYTLWKGTVSGCTQQQQSAADSKSSWLNHEVFCRGVAPSTYMDYAELEFILAEAALKGYIIGGEEKAKNYYEAGVTASIRKWAGLGQYSATPVTITDDDIVTFLSSSLASWDAYTNKKELIAEQKFLALFWIGMEAYHEYRRTEYPELTIGDGALNDKILPTRFAYPATTMATNAANAQEALNRMGGDNTMRTPVWWSKKAIDSDNN